MGGEEPSLTSTTDNQLRVPYSRARQDSLIMIAQTVCNAIFPFPQCHDAVVCLKNAGSYYHSDIIVIGCGCEWFSAHSLAADSVIL